MKVALDKSALMWKQAAWRRQAKKISMDVLGDECQIYPDKNNQKPFEDDGTLHVTRHGLRACFRVGVNDIAKEQNNNTRAIMAKLRLKVTDRVLIDESCDEDM